MRLDSITTDELDALVQKKPLLIFPIGATEAHGAHLPLGTDTFQAEYVADALSKKVKNAIVAPTLPYGNHSSLKDIAGTINITFDSLRSIVYDILESFIGHGIKKILVISGHAGSSHVTAITEACRDIVSEHNVKLMFVSDYVLCASEFKYEGDGHGGKLETSRMLSISPEKVRKERPKGKFVDAGGMILQDASSCIPDGIVGDTKDANAELGKKMNDYIVASLISMLERDMK